MAYLFNVQQVHGENSNGKCIGMDVKAASYMTQMIEATVTAVNNGFSTPSQPVRNDDISR